MWSLTRALTVRLFAFEFAKLVCLEANRVQENLFNLSFHGCHHIPPVAVPWGSNKSPPKVTVLACTLGSYVTCNTLYKDSVTKANRYIHHSACRSMFFSLCMYEKMAISLLGLFSSLIVSKFFVRSINFSTFLALSIPSQTNVVPNT